MLAQRAKNIKTLVNLKLVIAYDGTNYLGWQKTATGPSIEETMQNVIEKILQHPVHLQAASRTDSGVHAVGQVINFFTSKQNIRLDKLLTSMNSLLPKDIVVLELNKAPLHFHPTLDCSGKEYHYFLCTGPIQLPYHRLYSWHIYEPIDKALIQKALLYFVGEHDFSSFCNAKKNEYYQNHIRKIETLECIELEQNRFCIRVKGNHFLYKMVRNIVGTLVDIGKGKILSKDLPAIFQAHSRPTAGVTAPAHGLFLHTVFYPAHRQI